jgi:hypothetical protein
MAKPKTRAQLEAENEMLRGVHRWNAISDMFRTTVRTLGGVVIAFWVYKTAAVLAGHSTDASFFLGVLSDIKVSQGLLAAFGLGGLSYGARQRHLRKKNIERLEGRLRELEQMVDPGRSSSLLTRRGETPGRE